MACNVIYTRFIAYYNKLLEVPDGDLQIFFRTHARFRVICEINSGSTKIRAINNVTFDKIFHGSKRKIISVYRLIILGCGRKSKSPDDVMRLLIFAKHSSRYFRSLAMKFAVQATAAKRQIGVF